MCDDIQICKGFSDRLACIVDAGQSHYIGHGLIDEVNRLLWHIDQILPIIVSQSSSTGDIGPGKQLSGLKEWLTGISAKYEGSAIKYHVREALKYA